MGLCLCRGYVITEMDLLVFILRVVDRLGRGFFHVVGFIENLY